MSMANVPADLAAALGDHYALQRELGHGGMATVYLAHDLKHDRLVALKVLRPDLSHVLGRDRFVQEVRIIARLQHPHILPLFDSGGAGTREAGGGQLWYTMPYVEGESLRQRLEREGQLSLDEAIRISLNVLAALAYAHQHGIIHRDLKPENILLESGEAVVADFGIAHAVDAAGGERLTESGLALGTPTYMSPEQSAGSTVDGRSDIYSLGCVVYEMLAGEPPFTGPSPRAVLARHSIDPVPPLHTVRPAAPRDLERALGKALAKVPADRFGTATEFAAALSATLQTAPDAGPTAESSSWARRPAARKRLLGFIAVLFAIVFAGALTLARRPRSQAATVDPKVVAVVPFRVTGADSSLRYLREGMLDLLAAKLSGTQDLRAVDPRTLLRAWRRAGGSAESDLDRAGALRLTQEVGAGRLIEGEVIGTPRHTVLNATLTDAAGRREIRAGVEGLSDSLTSLVDRLAAQLLVLGSGESPHRLAGLTSYSLPALRAYLDGGAAHRRGDFAAAHDHFDRAIELDSTFALAALGRARAASWLPGTDIVLSTELAWRHRDRLSRRDFLLLAFMMGGQQYPLLGNARQDIVNAEAAVAAAPDNPEAWAVLGDHTYHFGPLMGMTDALERSSRAYRRALALDPTFVPAREHLHELYYEMGDTLAARKAVALRLALDSITPLAALARWFGRRFLGDSTLGNTALTDDSLLVRGTGMISAALRGAIGLADAESVLTLRRAAVSSEAEMKDLRQVTWTFYLIRGRPRRARAEMGNPVNTSDRAAMILDGLYGDADSAEAARVAAEVSRTFTRPTPMTTWEAVVERFAVAQYDLAHGRTRAAQDLVLAWKGAWNAKDTSQVRLLASNCALLLDAQIAARDRRPDARERLMELDSVLKAAPLFGHYLQTRPTFGGFEPLGNLLAARLWFDRGEAGQALATIRRRVAGLRVTPSYITSLRDEGRYAAAAGDRAGASRAYRKYLALRSGPEPAVRPKVEEVRAELAALERESTDR